jgi:hypothetical protein
MPQYGFNFLWMYVWGPGRQPQPPDERALDFMAELGFNNLGSARADENLFSGK